MAIFKQLFDDQGTSTLTYILADADTREGIIIDPVYEQTARDLEALKTLGVKLTHIVETHVHADHITGARDLKKATGAKFVAGAGTGLSCSDLMLADGDTLTFGNEVLHAISTPGHTNGCMSYRWRDRLFTGDTLLIEACGRTDFQEGSADTLYNSLQKLQSFPDEYLVFPGHDYNNRRVSSIGEEKLRNPYIVGLDRAAFIEKMENLNLPHPKRIDIAVPANQRCGEAA